MPQLVWTATPDGKLDYLNQGWIGYTGVTLDDIHAGTLSHVVHPDDLPTMWDRWNRAMATGETYEIEYRLRAHDGSYRWFLSRAVPIGENGTIERWIGTATDIDVQRRARDSLAFVVHAGSVLGTSLDETAICQELANVAVEGFADWCFVTLTTADGKFNTSAIAHRSQSLVHEVQQLRDRYPQRHDGPLAQVIATNIPILFERITPEQIVEAARDAEHLRVLQALRMQSVLIVPISVNQAVYGALTLVSAESGHTFDASDMDVAMTVAERAAIALQNARMFGEAERTSQRLRFTAKASQMLMESGDLKDTFDRIANLIVSEIADACFVARIDGKAVRAIAASHRDPELRPLVHAFVGTRTMQPEAEAQMIARLRNGKPILRQHVDLARLKSRGWPYLATGIDALQPTSAIVVPLQTRTATYGAIFVYYTDSGRFYDENDLPALVEIAARASIAIENTDTLERERRIATTLQEASLPSIIAQSPGLLFDAVYSPAGEEGEVGGDWYDAIDLDDGAVVVSVGDVTGQGLQAAVIMSKVRHAIGAVPRHERDPARILDSAGWFLRKRYPNAIVTAFVGVISPDRKSIRYANAGHPYPMLRRSNGELRELVAHGLPMGLRGLAEPSKSETAELREGDLLVLFTDGLIEWGRDWERGERRLRELLKTEAIAHAVEPAKLVESVCTPGRAHDDVAVLTVIVSSEPRWSFKVEDARAAENARTEFVHHLRTRITDRTLIENAELIFGELIGNVVRHAPGPVEVDLDWSEGVPVLHVIDTGKPFTPPQRLPDEMSESGRGLYIVQRIGRDLRVERIDDYGNHVRVELG
jgi:PAS domain S-box-containing protein